ncbi:hypothetical protein ONS95_014692 [Cadophora gregata]|uniref:uncharacterized protein n=1 Tax=Cadophora gregata TaxID=51156 RepID=UPI0026DDC77F|nr:uncharacterized protein ONS95_014692 [Cadophora gregata]KAK0112978.1 hypothetical protein ONS95_014692 [Cadophora gregata]KAK0125101.1 hypothetical protein ONS96_008968 [Cadophora gregata f. sp. sojae]
MNLQLYNISLSPEALYIYLQVFLPSTSLPIMASSPSSSTAPLSLTTDPQTAQVISCKTAEPPIKFETNTHIPLHKYQLTHNLLYERHFFGDSFISAHLQRLQNGVFISPNVHPTSAVDDQGEHFSKTFVTFAAIAFTLHPSLSEDHRFKSAVIEIRATTRDGAPLKVLRFAPHLAFGRISSASLKWNFQLGASLGVAQGPAKADLEPKVGFEKDLVVGSFMRIQGSTRSLPPALAYSTGPKIPDTTLVWSLEENSQQEGGLPREFTFVFLLERPLPKKSAYQSQVTVQPPGRPQMRKAATEGDEAVCCKQGSAALKYERIAGIDATLQEPRSVPPTPPRSPPPKKLIKRSMDLAHTLVAKAQSNFEEIEECVHTKTTELENELSHMSQKFHKAYVEPEPLHVTGEMPNARRVSTASSIRNEDVFTPIHFHISVKPRITNAPDKSTNVFAASEYDESIVEGQVGQRFGAFEHENNVDGESVLVDGLYNFAAMGGHFEDLVELPGSSVGTIEPSLPVK